MMADAAALLSRAHGVNSIAPPVPARLRRASSAAGCSQRLAVKPSCCRAPRTTAERAAFPQRRSRGSALQAASLDASELASSSEPEKSDPELACPICFRPFVGRGGKSGITCTVCNRTFPNRDFYDLTINSGSNGTFKEQAKTSQTLFESPLISFVYERGWRQGFAWAGFPGADAEFEISTQYLEPARGGVLLDVSCGSGLFTRRFAASGQFRHVVASDYSEAMLGQTKAFIDERRPPLQNYSLVRADVARLPFPTGSLDAVHAGAALHCWPSPSAGLAEISRVLRPGGVFVASTFLTPVAPLGEVLGDAAVEPFSQAVSQRTNQMRFWSEPELRDVCSMVGLSGFERRRERQFILFRAFKK